MEDSLRNAGSPGLQLRRRSLIARGAAGAATLAALGALGCRNSSKPAQQAPTGAGNVTPKRGGMVRNPQPSGSTGVVAGVGFDPHVVSSAFTGTYALWYQSLLNAQLPDFKLTPSLAQKWESVSPTEYVFTLQPGVKWHNKPPVQGRALTADDVVFSLERIRTNDPRFLERSLLGDVDTIQAPDKSTVRLNMKSPDASLLDSLASSSMAILAPEVVSAAHDQFQSADTAVGTGPFVLTDLQPNVSLTVTRNPDYWKSGLPYLDKIVVQPTTDDLTAWAAFLAGNVDVALVPGPEATGYLDRRGPGYKPVYYYTLALYFLYGNTKTAPMNDARVTKALRLLIDHEQIRKAYETQNGKGDSLFPFAPAGAIAGWGYSPQELTSKFLEWQEPKDAAVKQALDLLQAAGYTKDNPLRFVFTVRDSTTVNPEQELLQSQWKQFSGGVVDAQLKPVDNATMNKVRSAGQFTYVHGGETPGWEPHFGLQTQFRTGGSRNFAGFSDATIDGLISKEVSTFDATQRQAVVRQVVDRLVDIYPGTSLGAGTSLVASQPYVVGVLGDPTYGAQYETVWLNK